MSRLVQVRFVLAGVVLAKLVFSGGQPTARALARLLPLLLLAFGRAEASDPARALLGRDGGRPQPSTGFVAIPSVRDPLRVAVSADGERWAVGGERAVLASGPAAPAREIAVHRGVAALEFGPASLWAGGAGGLFELDQLGWTQRVPLGQGAAGAVRELSRFNDWLAIGSERGLFLRIPGEGLRALGQPLPRGPVSALDFAEGSDAELTLWVVIDAELFRLRGLRSTQSFQAIPQPMPELGRRNAVRQLLAEGDRVVLLTERKLFLFAGRRWRELPVPLPPGARAQAMAAGDQHWWVATERGLLRAPKLEGPWRFEAAPLANQEVHDVAVGSGVVLVATERGAFKSVGDSFESGYTESDPGLSERVTSLAEPTADAPRPHAFRAPSNAALREPEIREVQRAALRHQGLLPAASRALARGVRRRGWFPLVELRAGRARDSFHERDSDGVVSSGRLYRLEDRTRDTHRELDVGLVLRWDLGDVAYHPEAIDVSKEHRELIELRDEVLDEVTQLYFDRRRALAGMTGDSEHDSALRLRAAELASGLDAWTGGWWSDALLAARNSGVAAFDVTPRPVVPGVTP